MIFREGILLICFVSELFFLWIPRISFLLYLFWVIVVSQSWTHHFSITKKSRETLSTENEVLKRLYAHA
jgi:hypothetical protein